MRYLAKEATINGSIVGMSEIRSGRWASQLINTQKESKQSKYFGAAMSGCQKHHSPCLLK